MHALWHGFDINKHGGYLLAWTDVCRPKSQGGLGILNLCAQNKAMLMKHLHKFLNQVDIPWVSLTWKAFYKNRLAPSPSKICGSFWWKDLVHLLEDFKGLSHCSVYNNSSCLFWKDLWNFGSLLVKWLHLFSFAKNQYASVSQFLVRVDNIDHFHLPLSHAALQQLQSLYALLSTFELQPDRSDELSGPKSANPDLLCILN